MNPVKTIKIRDDYIFEISTHNFKHQILKVLYVTILFYNNAYYWNDSTR